MQVFSDENLEFLLEKGIDTYILDNFYKAEKRKLRKFRKSFFKYDKEKRTVIIVLLHLRSLYKK